ncbi:uncharacterized protein LOC122135816 [Cyprinus carpio]|uniref:Uncharacterized protein LOC122135816 n=1 Tax=Cyprinus carpio TaxID=7962 RepID=A0A9Q9ZSG5_CYPCA|nr:uncharacterized protein LOC122135816 [Cyprinus carpio]
MPGAQGELCQELTVPQPADIVSGNSVGLSDNEGNNGEGARCGSTATCGLFQNRCFSTPKDIPEAAGSYGGGIAGAGARAASYAPPPILAEATCSTSCMASRTLEYQGESGLYFGPDPLEGHAMDGTGCSTWYGLQKESDLHRRVQQGLGRAVRRETRFRPMVERGEQASHQLPRDDCSSTSLPELPVRPKEPPRAGQIGQHDGGLLYKSPRWAVVDASLQTDVATAGMDPKQFGVPESSASSGQAEQGRGYAVKKRSLLRRVETPPADGSEDMGGLWQSGNRPLCLKRQLSLPNIFFQDQGRVVPGLAQPSSLCFSSGPSDSPSNQAGQGPEMQGSACSPILGKSALDSRPVADADCSPMARSPETGPPFSGGRDDLASTPREVVSAHLVARREPAGLPERVLDTISQARAPSTRRLYASKWSVFSTWCSDHGESPTSCDVSVILSFLQELLEKGRSPSTLKVYVATIAASHALITGQSVGRNDLVVRFMRGARRLHPPCPPTVPSWDLPTVLRALKGAPFEPLQSIGLKALSLKTALLLALASVKRVGDLQALSISPNCLEFGPNDSRALSALQNTEEDPGLNLLCPVRALKVYIERSAPIRRSEQLFICFGNRTRGLPVSKQRLSRWIVDAIQLAYSSLGLQSPIGVRAHSTRAVSSSWAWSNGVTIAEICEAAGWSSPSTFARFYNLDVPALHARVLSV